MSFKSKTEQWEDTEFVRRGLTEKLARNIEKGIEVGQAAAKHKAATAEYIAGIYGQDRDAKYAAVLDAAREMEDARRAERRAEQAMEDRACGFED